MIMDTLRLGQTVEVRLKIRTPTEAGATTVAHVWRPGIIVFTGMNPDSDTGDWEVIVQCACTLNPRDGDELTLESVWGVQDERCFSFSAEDIAEGQLRVPPVVMPALPIP